MSPEAPADQNCLQFTEREKLYERIGHARFMALVARPDVVISSMEESTNAFGEFLFVTLRCRSRSSGRPVTFYGLGYHEQHERWVTEYWSWFESYRDQKGREVVPKQQAIQQLKEREEFVRAAAASTPAPSKQAHLYELMADLTDGDGAMTEMEDFGWAFLGDLGDE